jgi:hypothetical protein
MRLEGAPIHNGGRRGHSPATDATRRFSFIDLGETTMIRSSIIAAALTLVAAATPSFAGGYEHRTLDAYADSDYDGSVNRLVTDYSGRVVFDEKRDDCAPHHKIAEEDYDSYYGRRADHPVKKYGYGYYR